MENEKLYTLKQQLIYYKQHKETPIDYAFILCVFFIMFILGYFSANLAYLVAVILLGGCALFCKIMFRMELSDEEISKQREIEQEINRITNNIKKEQEEKQEALNLKICQAVGFHEKDHVSYNWYVNGTTSTMVHFFVDNTDRFAFRNGENFEIYKLEDINTVEALSEKYTSTTSIEKKSNTSIISRAVVGSVVAGGVGAVIGGLSGTSTIVSDSKEYATNTRVRVSLNSVKLPYFTIYTASEEVSRDIRDIILAIKNSHQ